MAEKNEVSQAKPMDLAINNSFIDGLATQLTEKQKYGLSFPKDYNPTNALNSAYLILQDMVVKKKKGNDWLEIPVLQHCTKQSIAASLLDMTVQALSPMKRQCYFIPYGDKLTLIRSYQGTMAIAKRVGAKRIVAEVIYKGDSFKYHIEDGIKIIDEHIQDFQNIDNENIIGAYAIVTTDEYTHVEIMNMKQLQKAWSKGKGYDPNKGVHTDFTDQMAKKTVINRACKNFINSSDDGYLMEAFEKTEENETLNAIDEEVRQEIEENANTIDFDEEVDVSGQVAEQEIQAGEVIEETETGGDPF